MPRRRGLLPDVGDPGQLEISRTCRAGRSCLSASIRSSSKRRVEMVFDRVLARPVTMTMRSRPAAQPLQRTARGPIHQRQHLRAAPSWPANRFPGPRRGRRRREWGWHRGDLTDGPGVGPPRKMSGSWPTTSFSVNSPNNSRREDGSRSRRFSRRRDRGRRDLPAIPHLRGREFSGTIGGGPFEASSSPTPALFHEGGAPPQVVRLLRPRDPLGGGARTDQHDLRRLGARLCRAAQGHALAPDPGGRARGPGPRPDGARARLRRGRGGRPGGVRETRTLPGGCRRVPDQPSLRASAGGAAAGTRPLRGDREPLLGDGPRGASPMAFRLGPRRAIRGIDRVGPPGAGRLREARRGEFRASPAGPPRSSRSGPSSEDRRVHPGRDDGHPRRPRVLAPPRAFWQALRPGKV